MVAVDDFLRKLYRAECTQHFPVRPVWRFANHLLEVCEGARRFDLFRHGFSGVAQKNPTVRNTDSRDAVGVMMQDAESDNAPPIMQNERDVFEVKHVYQR